MSEDDKTLNLTVVAGLGKARQRRDGKPPLLRHVRDLLTNPPAVRWLVRGVIEADPRHDLRAAGHG